MLLALFVALPQKSDCPSQKASEQDIAHGANEDIEYRGRTVNKLHGKILNPINEPIGEAVIEIYDYEDVDKGRHLYDIVRSKERRIAYLADKDGKFCITGLPSGKYVLRGGTRQMDGMNEVKMIINLDRRWWTKWLRSNKGIKVVLTPGT